MTTDVRDRSRQILHTELAIAASDYCAQHGFDAVTADDIAHNIGISRATFFRYFRSKEDAVVAAARTSRSSFDTGIRAMDAGTTAWAAARGAMSDTVVIARENPERLRARLRMIAASPGLRARLSLDRAEDRDTLAEALTQRNIAPDTARAVAGAALAAIDLGWSMWASDPASDLGTELDRAFALVAGASAVLLGQPEASAAP